MFVSVFVYQTTNITCLAGGQSDNMLNTQLSPRLSQQQYLNQKYLFDQSVFLRCVVISVVNIVY